MKILPSNIAANVGCSEDQVLLYMDNILMSIRTYTHRLFLTPIHYFGKVEVKNGEIKVDNLNINLGPGDTIELLLGTFNTAIMVVESVSDNTIKVYNSETLSDETFNGYVVKLHFNISVSIFITMLNYSLVTTSKIGVKSESLEGYSYTLNTDKSETVGGYPISVLSALNGLKQMPGQESREYARAGLFINQPLYG